MTINDGIDLDVLKAELLDAHYVLLSDEAAAAELNKLPSWKAGDALDRELVPAYEVFEAIRPGDLAALTNIELQRLAVVLSLGQVRLKGTNTRAILAALFAGKPSAGDLLSLQRRSASRAEALSAALFPNADPRPVYRWDVARARAS